MTVVTKGAQALAHIHHDIYQETEEANLGAPVGDWYSLSRHDRIMLSTTMQELMDRGLIRQGEMFKPIIVKAHAVKHKWRTP